MSKQDDINKLAQFQADMLQYKLYGSRYLKKPDGSIVIRTPEGTEMPIPEYVDYGDDDD